MAEAKIHETFTQTEEVRGASNRSFGLVFAGLFAIIGLWPLLDGEGPRPWSLVTAVALLFIAGIRPSMLAPFNRLWLKFGLLLHRVTNPIIMAFIFYLAVVPTALIVKLLGKDPLRRKLDKKAASYWIYRDPPGPSPGSMKNQF